jgi:hypothetical protein
MSFERRRNRTRGVMSSVAAGGSCRTKFEVHRAGMTAVAHPSAPGDQAKLKEVTMQQGAEYLEEQHCNFGEA